MAAKNLKKHPMRPNYTKIYQDMLKEKDPDKLNDPKVQRLIKNLKTTEDVLNFNELVFKQSKESLEKNQKLNFHLIYLLANIQLIHFHSL
jgi:hypothetical protein